MVGRRVYPNDQGQLSFSEGEYAQSIEDPAKWHIRPPGSHLGTIFNQRLTKNPEHHDIEEHEDGTITVSPSIQLSTGDPSLDWHGYLERGVWRKC